MARITGYTVVGGQSASEVAKYVNKLLDDGWEPYGELKVTTYPAKDKEGIEVAFTYAQVMVKREESEFAGT